MSEKTVRVITPLGCATPEELEEQIRFIHANKSRSLDGRYIGTSGRSWRDRQLRSMDYVAPTKWLTHFGYKGVFHGEPAYESKSPIEVSMSMTAGVQSEDQMIRMVMGRPLRKRDRVTLRYFWTWDLYEHDYWTVHDPVESNPRHVAVYCSVPDKDESAEQARQCWNQLDRARLKDLARSREQVESS